MNEQIIKLELTREQVTWLQVALLEAQIASSEEKRLSDADRYWLAYNLVGQQKRRQIL
jgi:hypothetical protein